MTFSSLSSRLSFCEFSTKILQFIRITAFVAFCAFSFFGAQPSRAQAKPAPQPDVLVLSNGDTLHGKLLDAANGTVSFHSDPLGDISVAFDKIKELHTTENFAVIKNGVYQIKKKDAVKIPTGPLEVTDKNVTVHPTNAAVLPPLPVADTQYIMNEATLDKQLKHHPGFFEGWNGAATAGVSTVNATQHSYAISAGVGLVRVVPTVSWLAPSNRTSVDFLGSSGKTTQPSYYTSTTPPVFVPEISTKTSIYHADAERDEYFTPRFFALALIAFDHNYSQNLDLQQIYGGGLGWTVIKTPKQELDLKGTIQYERQHFSTGETLNLVGSTFSANYLLKEKFFTFTQGLYYIPAYNDASAYSVSEQNLLSFPAYKNFSFSLGTLDSYLNNPPASEPPTRRNSFQFTMGLNYAIKSKY
jgi:hypothetical protein